MGRLGMKKKKKVRIGGVGTEAKTTMDVHDVTYSAINFYCNARSSCPGPVTKSCKNKTGEGVREEGRVSR